MNEYGALSGYAICVNVTVSLVPVVCGIIKVLRSY